MYISIQLCNQSQILQGRVQRWHSLLVECNSIDFIFMVIAYSSACPRNSEKGENNTKYIPPSTIDVSERVVPIIGSICTLKVGGFWHGMKSLFLKSFIHRLDVGLLQ